MPSLSQAQSFLLWCAGIHYAILIVTFLAWTWAGDALYRLHARWFDLDRRTCDAAIYLMLGFYKLATWLFFLVPWIVLCILRGQAGGP